MFKSGDYVYSQKYGYGYVVSIEGTNVRVHHNGGSDITTYSRWRRSDGWHQFSDGEGLKDAVMLVYAETKTDVKERAKLTVEKDDKMISRRYGKGKVISICTSTDKFCVCFEDSRKEVWYSTVDRKEEGGKDVIHFLTKRIFDDGDEVWSSSTKSKSFVAKVDTDDNIIRVKGVPGWYNADDGTSLAMGVDDYVKHIDEAPCKVEEIGIELFVGAKVWCKSYGVGVVREMIGEHFDVYFKDDDDSWNYHPNGTWNSDEDNKDKKLVIIGVDKSYKQTAEDCEEMKDTEPYTRVQGSDDGCTWHNDIFLEYDDDESIYPYVCCKDRYKHIRLFKEDC